MSETQLLPPNFRMLAEDVGLDPRPDSACLTILCSGRRMGLRSDRFNFMRSTADLSTNRLFLRDSQGLWYQGGLRGSSRTMGATIRYLKAFRTAGGYRRLSVMGISAGGYAALILGAALKADVTISLAPRTLLRPDPDQFADHHRHGAQAALTRLQHFPRRQERFFDLRRWLKRHPPCGQICDVWFDPHHPLDAFHATRLQGLPGLRLRQLPGAGHGLGRMALQQPGLLDSLVPGDDDPTEFSTSD